MELGDGLGDGLGDARSAGRWSGRWSCRCNQLSNVKFFLVEIVLSLSLVQFVAGAGSAAGWMDGPPKRPPPPAPGQAAAIPPSSGDRLCMDRRVLVSGLEVFLAAASAMAVENESLRDESGRCALNRLDI